MGLLQRQGSDEGCWEGEGPQAAGVWESAEDNEWVFCLFGGTRPTVLCVLVSVLTLSRLLPQPKNNGQEVVLLNGWQARR